MCTIAILRSSFQSFILWQRDGWLIYGYGSAEKVQTCFKNISMKRGQDGDLIDIKIPRFFYFSFIYQLKKSEASYWHKVVLGLASQHSLEIWGLLWTAEEQYERPYFSILFKCQAVHRPMLIWSYLQFIAIFGCFLWKFLRTNNSLEQGITLFLLLISPLMTYIKNILNWPDQRRSKNQRSGDQRSNRGQIHPHYLT